MKNFIKNHKRILIDIAVLASAFIFVFASYFIFKPLYFKSDALPASTDGVINRIYVYVCLTAIVITGVVLKIKGKLTIELTLFLIFLLGVVMQLNYMLITPFNYRQHDVLGDEGHEAYAWILYATGKLPNVVDEETGYLAYQFYHPPFNAFIQSTFMHVCKPFMQLYNAITGSAYYDITDRDTLFQTSEILSCFYMNVATYFAIKIAYKLKVANRFKVFGALFVALFPALFILAGQENNDPLCVMNCFIVVYFTVAWWENRSYFNAAMIGLFTGLAMFAKLSGALIILPAIVAFAIVLIQNIIKKDGSFKHQLIQGAMIGLVAAPIGLWFHIYANVKYNQPFGYVWPITWNALYVGNHNFFERFINIFDFKDMTSSIWGRTIYDFKDNIPNNYNLPNFLIKSALFGEYSFICADAFAVISLFFNYLFVYSSLALMVIYFIFSKKENIEAKIIGGVIVVSQLLAQLYFNIKYPFGCTMDFRYIVPIILGFMILNVLAFDKFSKEKDWKFYFSQVTMYIGYAFIGSISIFYLIAI